MAWHNHTLALERHDHRRTTGCWLRATATPHAAPATQCERQHPKRQSPTHPQAVRLLQRFKFSALTLTLTLTLNLTLTPTHPQAQRLLQRARLCCIWDLHHTAAPLALQEQRGQGPARHGLWKAAGATTWAVGGVGNLHEPVFVQGPNSTPSHPSHSSATLSARPEA